MADPTFTEEQFANGRWCLDIEVTVAGCDPQIERAIYRGHPGRADSQLLEGRDIAREFSFKQSVGGPLVGLRSRVGLLDEDE